MGVFDSVMIPCPGCGEVWEIQSKVGDCCLMSYTLDDAPKEIQEDVAKEFPIDCYNCGLSFTPTINKKPVYNEHDLPNLIRNAKNLTDAIRLADLDLTVHRDESVTICRNDWRKIWRAYCAIVICLGEIKEESER